MWNTLIVFLLLSPILDAFLLGNQGVAIGHSKAVLSATPVENEATSTVNSQRVPDMKAYSKGYKTVFQEQSYRTCEATSTTNPQQQGGLPTDMQPGTYYRAGPAMFSSGSIVPPKTSIVQPRQPPVPDGQDMARMQKHPFDADGAVLAVTMGDDGIITSRYRFVRTVAFTAERKKGARVYTGLDQTRDKAIPLGNDHPLPLYRHHLLPGLNKLRRNTCNTRPIYWGRRLLALFEGGQPFKLDAKSLDTEGKSLLGGAIRRDSDPFGGKMAYDPKKKRALFYGIEQGLPKSEITLYEFDEKFRLVDNGKKYINVPGLALINDFLVTDNYAVFVQPPISAGVRFLVNRDPGQTLKLERKASTLHLIPRVDSAMQQLAFEIPITDGIIDANLQLVNAYEEDDTIVFDAIRSDTRQVSAAPLPWPWGETIEEYRSIASKKSLWRYTVNIKSGSVAKKLLDDTHCVFPTINPEYNTRKHRFIYTSVGGMGNEVAPPQGISRYDCDIGSAQTWMPETDQFCGEPTFVPRKESQREDDGYIMTVLFDGKAEESRLIVLDAADVSAGPVCEIPLGMAIPHGLFGCYATDDASWDHESIVRRCKLADKVEAKGNRWNMVKSDFSGLGLRLDDMEEYFGDFFS